MSFKIIAASIRQNSSQTRGKFEDRKLKNPALSLKILTIALSWAFVPVANARTAQDFVCASQKNFCVVEDSNIVTGDQLGFFTSDGELIATGKVQKMTGAKRTIKLNQILGPVHLKATSYAMLNGSKSAIRDEYRIYKRQTPTAIGTFTGLTSFSAGGDAKGYEGSAEILKRNFIRNLDGNLKTSFYSLSGSAVNAFDSRNTGKFKANIFAASGGISYELVSLNDFAIRTELGLGLAYTTAKINDSAANAASDDWGYKMKSGIVPHYRGSVKGGYKFTGWQLEAGISPAMVANKVATTIGAGFLWNL